MLLTPGVNIKYLSGPLVNILPVLSRYFLEHTGLEPFITVCETHTLCIGLPRPGLIGLEDLMPGLKSRLGNKFIVSLKDDVFTVRIT